MKNETLDLPNPNPSARIEPKQQRLPSGGDESSSEGFPLIPSFSSTLPVHET